MVALIALGWALMCGTLRAGDVQARLKALEKAHKAGILTDEEYARKKAELEARLKADAPPVDEATRRKLKALEEAHKAGVLSDEEYARKKAEIMKKKAPAAPVPAEAGPAPRKAPHGKAPHGKAPPGQGKEPRQTTGKPILPRKKGKTYRHTFGFTFWYPEKWRIRVAEGGLHLVPPDLKSNQYGPTEAYLVIGDSAEEITRPDDPRVIRYFEERIMGFAPFLRRTGTIESVRTSGGPGALILWEGRNPAGMEVRARVHVVLLKGFGVALVALGERGQIEARKPTLKAMFSSFGVGAGEKDPRLVGRWRTERHFFSGTFSSTTIRHMILRPNGTFTSGGRLLAGMDHHDGGGDRTGSTSLDTGKARGEHGRWAAGKGRLYLMWKDGSYAEYGYHIEGQPGSRSLLLKPPGGKNQLWGEVR
jgi:hypothetical protein